MALFTIGGDIISAEVPVSTKACVSYRTETRQLVTEAKSLETPVVIGKQGKVCLSKETTDEVKKNPHDVILNVTLLWDSETEMPLSIAIMGGEEPYYATLDGYPADAVGFWIPIPPEKQGIKQVVLCMQRTTYFGFNGEYKFLIFPDCDLSNDLDLVINTADADKLVSFITFNPDGEESTLDSIIFGEEGFIPIENGNIRGASIETYLRYKNHTFYPQNAVMNMDFKMDDEIFGKFPGLALKDVYINLLTDDWKLVQYRSMFASDRENHFTVILEAGSLDGDVTVVSNNPGSYSFCKPEIEATLIPDDHRYAIFPVLKNDGISLGSGLSIFINNDRCWVSIPENISEGLSVTNKVILATSTFDDVILSPSIGFNLDGPTTFFESPLVTSLAMTSSIGVSNPLNPYFAIPFSDNNILGTSSPFMVLGMTNKTESAQVSSPILECQAAGSLGEIMKFASNPKSISVACNGNTFFQDGRFQDYSQAYLDAGSPKGNMVLKAQFNNFSQDGLPGEVNIVSKWNNADDPDDTVPPTLTFLQLKDKEDVATSCFNNPEEAVIAFSAGDFEPKVIMDAIVMEDFVYNHDYVEYQPLSEARFEVAPYGSDDYIEMPVTEIPENLVECGFGAYYSVDIADLNMKSTSGWFDIRITLTDEKGNTQEQTISPAFKIESLSFIDNLFEDQTQIYTKGNSIIAPADARIFSIDGLEFGKNNLPSGTYIVKTSVQTKKLIIK